MIFCLWAVLGCTGLSPQSIPKRPLWFEENQGQFPSDILFAAVSSSHGFFLSHNGLTTKVDTGAGIETLQLSFIGGASGRTIAPRGPALHTASYYLGSDPSRWVRGARSFGEVIVSGVYPGIDVRYSIQGEQVEYDFLVRPGADPSLIELHFDHENGAASDEGDLTFPLGGGAITQTAPYLYQDIAGQRVEISGQFIPRGAGNWGFQVSEYDPAETLIIDPVDQVTAATYIGSAADDLPAQIKYVFQDGGNLPIQWIAVGTTSANAFFGEGTNGGSDGVIMLWTRNYGPNGTSRPELMQTIVIGGSGPDKLQAMAISGRNYFVVGGVHNSPNFPGNLPPGQFAIGFQRGGDRLLEPTGFQIQLLDTQRDLKQLLFTPHREILTAPTHLLSIGDTDSGDSRAGAVCLVTLKTSDKHCQRWRPDTGDASFSSGDVWEADYSGPWDYFISGSTADGATSRASAIAAHISPAGQIDFGPPFYPYPDQDSSGGFLGVLKPGILYREGTPTRILLAGTTGPDTFLQLLSFNPTTRELTAEGRALTESGRLMATHLDPESGSFDYAVAPNGEVPEPAILRRLMLASLDVTGDLSTLVNTHTGDATGRIHGEVVDITEYKGRMIVLTRLSEETSFSAMEGALQSQPQGGVDWGLIEFTTPELVSIVPSTFKGGLSSGILAQAYAYNALPWSVRITKYGQVDDTGKLATEIDGVEVRIFIPGHDEPVLAPIFDLLPGQGGAFFLPPGLDPGQTIYVQFHSDGLATDPFPITIDHPGVSYYRLPGAKLASFKADGTYPDANNPIRDGDAFSFVGTWGGYETERPLGYGEVEPSANRVQIPGPTKVPVVMPIILSGRLDFREIGHLTLAYYQYPGAPRGILQTIAFYKQTVADEYVREFAPLALHTADDCPDRVDYFHWRDGQGALAIVAIDAISDGILDQRDFFDWQQCLR